MTKEKRKREFNISLDGLRLVGGENFILQQKARKIAKLTPEIKELMNRMVLLMREYGGVGLAAPQIGIPLQIFVMEVKDIVYRLANPRIIFTSGEIEHEEACLSIPGFYGITKRSALVIVEALTYKGGITQIQGEQLLGQCIQHETDHLMGKLYTANLVGDLKERIKEEKV